MPIELFLIEGQNCIRFGQQIENDRMVFTHFSVAEDIHGDKDKYL